MPLNPFLLLLKSFCFPSLEVFKISCLHSVSMLNFLWNVPATFILKALLAKRYFCRIQKSVLHGMCNLGLCLLIQVVYVKRGSMLYSPDFLCF